MSETQAQLKIPVPFQILVIALHLLIFLTNAGAQSTDSTTVPAQEAAQHLIKKIEPVYPPLAKAAGIGGVVKIQISIDESGKISNIKVLKGHPLLVQAAINAVRQWEFTPFSRNEESVPVTTEIEVEFDSGTSPKVKDANEKHFLHFRAGEEAYRKGNYEKSEEEFKKALHFAEMLPPNRYIERAVSVRYLGSIAFSRKRFDKAERLLKEYLAMRLEHQRRDEAEIGGALANLAQLYHAQNRFDEAIPLYAESIAIYEYRLNHVNPGKKFNDMRNDFARQIIMNARLLAATYVPGSKIEEAEPRLRRAIRVADTYPDAINTEEIIVLLRDYSVVLHALNRNTEANQIDARLRSLSASRIHKQ